MVVSPQSVWSTMKTENSNGRVVAIQQQLFFAQMLSDNMDITSDFLLRKLAMTGLRLTSDIEEVALDAAAIQPHLRIDKTGLYAVPDDLENL
jgi:hypothetical protein